MQTFRKCRLKRLLAEPLIHELLALESAHAIAQIVKLAPTLSKDKIVVVNLSGRGDKDCQEVARLINA